MTVIEVIDLARDILNEPLESSRGDNNFPDDTSSFFTDTELVRYFNQVQRELNLTVIQSFENYLVTESDINVSPTDVYTLPTNMIKIVRVEDLRNSPATEIYPISLNEKDRYVTGRFNVDLRNQGNPDRYFLKGNSIVFRPIPNFTQNSAIRVYYAKRVEDAVASTASNGASFSSEIPAEYHEALTWGVVKKAWARQQTDTTPADREFLRLKEEMKKALEDRQVQLPRFIKELRD